MAKMKFKRFGKEQVLRQIGRRLLNVFLKRFQGELDQCGTVLPSADASEDEYYLRVTDILKAPEGLPERMVDALFAIDEMADHEGQERLEQAMVKADLPLRFHPDSTHADIAMQVWLETPDLLKQEHENRCLVRLSVFDYYCGKRKCCQGRVASQVCQATMALMKQDLDKWFAEHSRGEQATQIELQEIEGEQWFLIRHGDTFTRTTKVENTQLARLHFRPAKDDVVVYSPELDELRIHAGTQGEKELYRVQFGRRLHGDDGHFQAQKEYSLEPLREDGEQALDPEGIGGIKRIVLREFEVVWKSNRKESLVRKSVDIFAVARARNWNAIPKHGRIERAVFDVYFPDAKKPRRVQIRTPNTLKLGRQCDAPLVHQWLCLRRFSEGRSME